MSDDDHHKTNVKRAAGIAAGAGLALICPPAALVAGVVGFLRGSRRYAHSQNPEDAIDMVIGLSDVSDGTRSGE